MLRSLRKSQAVASLTALLGALYLRLLDATSSKTIVGREKFDEARARGCGVILTFWHGRLMLAPFVRRKTDAEVNMLISSHRDGEMIAKAVSGFGIKFIRGSSANLNKPGKPKHGATAVAQMLDALARGEVVAITPDGPRGPAETFQAGAVRLAQRSGAVIIPAGASSSRGRRLNSWDRFLLATPFARLVYVAGDPLTVAADTDAETIERIRLELQARLSDATKAADEISGQAKQNEKEGEK